MPCSRCGLSGHNIATCKQKTSLTTTITTTQPSPSSRSSSAVVKSEVKIEVKVEPHQHQHTVKVEKEDDDYSFSNHPQCEETVRKVSSSTLGKPQAKKKTDTAQKTDTAADSTTSAKSSSAVTPQTLNVSSTALPASGKRKREVSVSVKKEQLETDSDDEALGLCEDPLGTSAIIAASRAKRGETSQMRAEEKANRARARELANIEEAIEALAKSEGYADYRSVSSTAVTNKRIELFNRKWDLLKTMELPKDACGRLMAAERILDAPNGRGVQAIVSKQLGSYGDWGVVKHRFMFLRMGLTPKKILETPTDSLRDTIRLFLNNARGTHGGKYKESTKYCYGTVLAHYVSEIKGCYGAGDATSDHSNDTRTKGAKSKRAAAVGGGGSSDSLSQYVGDLSSRFSTYKRNQQHRHERPWDRSDRYYRSLYGDDDDDSEFD